VDLFKVTTSQLGKLEHAVIGDTCTAPDLQAAQAGEILGQAKQAPVIEATAILHV
jgi:hypothetical protein